MTKPKVMIITTYAPEAITFRGDLIKKIKDRNYEIVIVSPKDNIAFDLLKSEFKVSCIEWKLKRTGTNPIQDMKSIRELQKIVQQEKPDYIMSYTAKAVIYTGLIKTKAKRIALMSGLGSVLRYEGNCFKNKTIRNIMILLNKISLPNYNNIIFQNEDDQLFLKNIVNLQSIETDVVFGSGVDPEKFMFNEVKDNNKFIFVGRLLKDKGIYEFLKASEVIKNKYPHTQFTVLGDTDDNPTSISKEELNYYINKGIINYKGQVENVELELRNSDVFVLPSYHEGTSRAALEAMSTGRILVMSNAPGCDHLVDGNGYLCQVKSADSLIEKMEMVLSLNKDEIKKMSYRSRELINNKYSNKVINDQMLSIIFGGE